MLNKFTQKAQKALRIAQAESRRMHHDYIGTGHILLGLVALRDGMASAVFVNLGINTDSIIDDVEERLGMGAGAAMLGDIPYSFKAKRILEIAIEESHILGQHYVGTEHLLLALLRVKEGVAASVLEKVGLTIMLVRQEVALIMRDMDHATHQETRKAKTPMLDEFSKDLTDLARLNALDPVIGREKEVERLVQILSRRTKNNPILIGDPGVGKTAIVEGLAQRIVLGNIPETLKNKKIVVLDMIGVVAGTKYRGEFEERLKKIIDEIVKQKNEIIIFIDELHTVIGAGSSEGGIDASNILKPSLARGELQCIGATTLDEYRRYIEHDAALERRFQPIVVDPPSVEETIDILKGLRDRYEDHHHVSISDDAIRAAAELSERYITNRFLPDKAIDLIDEAGSRVHLKSLSEHPECEDINEKYTAVVHEKKKAIEQQEFEKAARLLDEERKIISDARVIRKQVVSDTDVPTIEAEDVAVVISQWTGIPVCEISRQETEKLLSMEKYLSEEVVGQEEAIKIVSQAIRRSRAGLKDPRHPIGIFMFIGPTGIGKTKLAKTLAKFLFGKEDFLVRCDMSEYMEKFSLSRLIGAPPGYVGYTEGGQLTEAVRRRPYAVVLLDEIEKAHPDIANILLQVFDEGVLTDGLGHKVSFANTIIIMTSNIGTPRMNKSAHMGFKASDEENISVLLRQKVFDELRKNFNPELLNRIGETVFFNYLENEDVKKILDIMIREIFERIEKQGISISITDEAKEFIIKKGYDKNEGVRHLKRVVQKYVEDRIAESILKTKSTKNTHIAVEMVNDTIEANPRKNKEKIK
ncbi:MAG: ATP-dependent Clp protease ATP-binding subunit [Elusimicrobiota bacterium]